MERIELEELALLEVLQHIDQSVESEGDGEVHARLVSSGLAEQTDDGLRLTAAGIELCKSLQHRVAADNQVRKVLEGREREEAAAGAAATGRA